MLAFCPPTLQASPSPHGRVGTNHLLVVVLSRCESPSPHGRVGTCLKPCGLQGLGLLDRRPLMVGSEPMKLHSHAVARALVAVPSWSGRNGRNGSSSELWKRIRRPLMVGSEPIKINVASDELAQSPSPHGRVGTSVRVIMLGQKYRKESPSPHGRVGTRN